MTVGMLRQVILHKQKKRRRPTRDSNFPIQQMQLIGVYYKYSV